MVLFPFEAPRFEPATERAQETGEAIMEQPVQIVTSFAPGPHPVKSAPPGYDLNMQAQTAILMSEEDVLVRFLLEDLSPGCWGHAYCRYEWAGKV